MGSHRAKPGSIGDLEAPREITGAMWKVGTLWGIWKLWVDKNNEKNAKLLSDRKNSRGFITKLCFLSRIIHLTAFYVFILAG